MKVSLIMFSLNMLDYPMSFFSLPVHMDLEHFPNTHGYFHPDPLKVIVKLRVLSHVTQGAAFVEQSRYWRPPWLGV